MRRPSPWFFRRWLTRLARWWNCEQLREFSEQLGKDYARVMAERDEARLAHNKALDALEVSNAKLCDAHRTIDKLRAAKRRKRK